MVVCQNEFEELVYTLQVADDVQLLLAHHSTKARKKKRRLKKQKIVVMVERRGSSITFLTRVMLMKQLSGSTQLTLHFGEFLNGLL